MDNRYASPVVARLWSLEWTYTSWLHIEALTLKHQIERGVVPERAESLLTPLLRRDVDLIDVQHILEIERRRHHDVAAFLEWVRSWAPGNVSSFLHYGLTSSDLVETTQGIRFGQLRPELVSALSELQSEMARWATDGTPVLGRTHGQVAEAMTMQARAWAWLTSVAQAGSAMLRTTRNMRVAKLSGPVGVYSHTPPEVEAAVAIDLDLYPHGPGATQIASRQPLAAWASSASQLVDALNKVAHDLRLMNLLGEVAINPPPGYVGSSSMAHKINPIQAEQLGGMSALARGYALALQQQPLWLERDISNSSVERVAIPDLWHIVFHSIKTMTEVLRSYQVDQWGTVESFDTAGNQPLVFERTMENIAAGMSWHEAREQALKARICASPEQGSRAMANYPNLAKL